MSNAEIAPKVVTFWEGPLTPLLRVCLRSQVAAGHQVVVYSFAPIAGLPSGVTNADAEKILPRDFSRKLRPGNADGSWPTPTAVQFSDFFRMRLMELNSGLWLDTDVLLLRPAVIDRSLPYFAYEYTKIQRPIRRARGILGNSALYLPSDSPIVRAYAELRQQQELFPEWIPLDYKLMYFLRRLRDKSARIFDIRFTIYGPPAMTILARRSGEIVHAMPRKSFYSIHRQPKRFFDPWPFERLIEDKAVIGLHITPKHRQHEKPLAGSLHAWAVDRFG